MQTTMDRIFGVNHMIYLCAECAHILRTKGTHSKEKHQCKLCGRISFGVEVKEDETDRRGTVST